MDNAMRVIFLIALGAFLGAALHPADREDEGRGSLVFSAIVLGTMFISGAYSLI